MKKDNRIIVNLRHVSYARLYYENQYGQRRDINKTVITTCIVSDFEYKGDCKGVFSVRNEWHCKCETKVYGNGQSLYEYARSQGLVDVWTPTLYLQLQANHSLVYTGKKALSIWNKWREMQFANKDNTKKKGKK